VARVGLTHRPHDDVTGGRSGPVGDVRGAAVPGIGLAQRVQGCVDVLVLVPAGARFRASNTGADPATAWVTTQLGMRARMDGSGETLIPPWAE